MAGQFHGRALIAAITLIAPVAAPAQFSEGFTFLKAVQDADGQKVTDILNKPGSGAVIINTRDPSSGETALHIAAKRRDATWLGFLLAKGANPDLRDNLGNTPLMDAAQLGFGDGISLLVARRAAVDLGNNSGESPLMRAVQNRDIASVRLLLMAGANPDRADRASGLSPRQFAVRDQRSANIVKAIDDVRPKPKAAFGPN